MKTQDFLRILKYASVCAFARVCTHLCVAGSSLLGVTAGLRVGRSAARAAGSPGTSAWAPAGRGFYTHAYVKIQINTYITRRSHNVPALVLPDVRGAALLRPRCRSRPRRAMASRSEAQGWCYRSLVGSGLKETCFHVNVKTIYLSP